VQALESLAREVFDPAVSANGADPLAPPTGDGPFRVTRTASGAVAHLSLPGATKDQVHLARNGDDLVVTVGSYRRLMTLPLGLARLRIAGARVEAGELQVRFVERSARSNDEPEAPAARSDADGQKGGGQQ
jgi:arsenite-transporting ATPase